MAYGVQSVNDYVLIGSGTNENPNQLDTILFTDFGQHSAVSATNVAEGGVFSGSLANGGSIQTTSAALLALRVVPVPTRCAPDASVTPNASNDADEV